MPTLSDLLGWQGEETDAVRRCIAAVVEGPFIDDQEGRTTIGWSRSEIVEVLRRWEDSDHGPDVASIVNNCLWVLVFYPHDHEEASHAMTGLERADIARLLKQVNRHINGSEPTDRSPPAFLR